MTAAPGSPRPWTAQELTRIGEATDLSVSTRRRDGTLRAGIPIWQVTVDDAVYIRSARGVDNGWFRRALHTGLGHIRSGGVEQDVTFRPADPSVNDRVTAAYHHKYDRYGPGPVGAVTGADVDRTTLLVAPAASEPAQRG